MTIHLENTTSRWIVFFGQMTVNPQNPLLSSKLRMGKYCFHHLQIIPKWLNAFYIPE